MDILSHPQKKLLPELNFLGKNFFLAGGTAIALQMGHRKSLDFDFFNRNLKSPFMQQIIFFEDIDYSEAVEWVGTEIDSEVIKQYLIQKALEI